MCGWDECEYLVEDCFNGCISLSQINLPNCQVIESRAFYGCKSLKSLVLLSCTSVFKEAFRNSGIEDIDLRNCLYIANNVFTSSNLKRIKLSNKLKELDTIFQNTVIDYYTDDDLEPFKNTKFRGDGYERLLNNNKIIVHRI